MYNHTLHRRRKHFCRYCTEELLKGPIKNYFKMNDQQNILMPQKKNEYIRFKNCKVTVYNFINSMTEESK